MGKKLDVEKTLKNTVEKHNLLSDNFTKQTEQFTGAIEALRGMLEETKNEVRKLMNHDKTLTFHINKVYVEIETIKNFLASMGVSSKDYMQKLDSSLEAELGVNSKTIPVGKCFATYYNCP